ncbi:hypothetical protein ASPSYDRAFT_151191 [Aspergillus sydowii CBS 593.65]|uniref:Macro-like domain-containing protein n=1 Tax=Aspergillus sydowii CBS 593.65 TaxID=1036612 RepID=A0A1L9TI68_9EURO|nr:uncharacterized protein ASPSYDRAFT_151191 [Aspergillus sydowii CBS 593.65]OJJ59120.1 hypothetical protein ASPSYDRAFT_151191 [Aspergillus sydowii CBS 593.65]
MTSNIQNIPKLHLLCMESRFITAFSNAIQTHWPSYHPNKPTEFPSIEIHNCRLAAVPASTKFDLVVSPANSYGRLDGAFDDAISRAFCLPHHHYDTLTHAVQDVLYEKYRGFLPPGACELVCFPEELIGQNEWGCEWVAICPTMRTPEDVVWDREVVYQCIWSLLCAIEGWNRRAGAGGDAGSRIETILITPMATGCGAVSPDRWAAQMVLAMRHFVDALEKPERWSRLDWREIYDDTGDVEKTWKQIRY